MDRPNILSIARSALSAVEPVNENIYRGEFKINNSAPAGIFFLDLTGTVTADSFVEYQEKLLADEYYNQPGSLQWNYYLFLLQDQVDSTTKERIESDDKYARKYVLNEAEFKNFFKLEDSTTQLSGNIVLEWKKKLDDLGLHEVYSKVPFTSGVENFLKNNAPKVKTNTITASSPAQEPLKFINKIKLTDTYREYPKPKRTFEFAKVNLFKGSNGVGKTSLFEAIELIACGTTFRNMDKREPDNCIEATINNNLIRTEMCTPSKSEKYRTRDLFWYNNDYQRSNNTAISFNRFNFFNTDAANNFSTSNNEEEIKKALLNLILGAEYTYILTRINGFYERIRPNYNQLKREMEAAAQTILQSDLVIGRLKQNNAIESLKNVVQDNISNLRLKTKDLKVDENTAPIEIMINQLKSLLDIILTEKEKSIHSINNLNDQFAQLTSRRETYNIFKTQMDVINNSIADKQRTLTKERETATLLVNVLKYLEAPQALQLKGLKARKSTIVESLRNITIIKRTIGEIDLNQYRLSEKIKDYLTENTNKLSIARQDLTTVETNITSLLGKFGRITQLLSQIKILGKEYITTVVDATTCPLCESNFTRDDLVSAVNREMTEDQSVQEQIEQLTLKQTVLKTEIEKLSLHNENLGKIQIASSLIHKNEHDDIPLSSMILGITDLLKQEPTLQNMKEALQMLEEWAVEAKLSEEELANLETQMQGNFGDKLIISNVNKENIETNKNNSEARIEQLNTDINELQENRAKLSMDIKSTLELPQDKPIKPSEITEIFDSTERRLAGFRDTFKNIQDTISITDNTDLGEVESKLSLLTKNIQTLKSAFQDQVLLKNAKTQKQQAEDFIKKNRENFHRIEKGIQVLGEWSADNGSGQLNTFFNQNMAEVNDIFKTIHSPREFSSLNVENGQLSLIKSNGDRRKISQISTGQRAALALALFISLNRQLKNGPDIILFDDPVSHIDDLNALSFLDFLRFFMLKEEKQIFFSTANARLASLIEKKFSFLGSDFRQFELHRDIA